MYMVNHASRDTALTNVTLLQVEMNSSTYTYIIACPVVQIVEEEKRTRSGKNGERYRRREELGENMKWVKG